MTKEELGNLERLMNFLSFQFLKKIKWQDVSKTEWLHISAEIKERLQQKGQKAKEPVQEALGDHYFYEHLIVKKLKPWKNRTPVASIGIPSFSKLNRIAGALGYNSYIEFINSAEDAFHFNELKINVPLAFLNTTLLNNLTGHWYCYNRNAPFHSKKGNEERVRRSSMEIYKAGDEYLVERSGKDNHKYYGKITAYADYIFIIMNSTTYIRQRHFISRIKDVVAKLKYPEYKITQLGFVSTCVSFNEEPIALYEIFERVAAKDYLPVSVDLSLDNEELPKHIVTRLKDIEKNRIIQH